MTTKSAILLIIKQSHSADYNSLLNKISPNYSSINSARAALSRILKDLCAFDFIEKRDNNFYITEKGNASLSKEMKSKFLLKLNQIIRLRNPQQEIDSIVKHLHMLIERGKEDKDLLKAARDSAEFYVSELRDVKESVSSRIEHLNYLQRVFKRQIEELKRLNFNDYCKLEYNEKNFNRIKTIIERANASSFMLETKNKALIGKIASLADKRVKGNSVLVAIEDLQRVLSLVEPHLKNPSEQIVMHFPTLKLEVAYPYICVYAPYATISKLLMEVRSGELKTK